MTKEMMKMVAAAAVAACQALFLLLLATMTLGPVSAQQDDEQLNGDQERNGGWGSPRRDIKLYEGPLVHDQQWVMRRGTTNNNLLGVFGGTCSLIPSNVRNVSGYEQVRFEAEYQGLGVWDMAWVDTVTGDAVADTGQRYRYTYRVRFSYTGVTTDGRAPRPSRAMPTPTNPGFLETVPGNVVAAALNFRDIFLLRDEATGRLLADAHVNAWFHFRLNPSEQPPSFFPAVQDGYIATSLQTVAGQAGCDPL
jgi:hypothetical protein